MTHYVNRSSKLLSSLKKFYLVFKCNRISNNTLLLFILNERYIDKDLKHPSKERTTKRKLAKSRVLHQKLLYSLDKERIKSRHKFNDAYYSHI